MTAINILRQRDRIHIFSDGHGFSLAGGGQAMGIALRPTVPALDRLGAVDDVRDFLVTKVMLLPHLNAIIGVRGSSPHFSAVLQFLPFLGRTFDQVCDDLGGRLRGPWQLVVDEWCRSVADHNGLDEKRGLLSRAELILAGMSDATGEPAAFILATHQSYDDIPAWQLTPLPAFQLVPHVPWLADELAPAAECEAPDIDAIAVRAIEGQRGEALTRPDGTIIPGSAEIGGFVQVSTVSAAGITSRIVKRFDVRGTV